MSNSEDRRGGWVERIFGRVPKRTSEQVSAAMRATAEVRRQVQPTISRAHQVAEDYAELDRILSQRR